MAASTIDALPDEIYSVINDLLAQRVSYRAIIAKLRELGVEHISHSAMGRYAKRKSAMLERTREMSEMARGFAKGLNADDDGKDTTMLTAILRRAIFMLLSTIDPEDEDQFRAKAIELQQLGKALESAAKADALSTGRILAIRKEERISSFNKFESEAIKRGISAQTINDIRAEILGLDDDA